MNEKPEALRLAGAIHCGDSACQCSLNQAASELRRLHAENQKLRAALDEQMLLHNETLDELRVAEQEIAAIDSQPPAAIDWEVVVNEIRALPTRSTGYPPYQHSPDWVKQQAADIVQRQMGE